VITLAIGDREIGSSSIGDLRSADLALDRAIAT
jgi:hypothetical protein